MGIANGTPLDSSSATTRVPTVRTTATVVLVVLTAINFVNYIDRYVVGAVANAIGHEFAVGDDVTGLVGSVFMVVYTVVAPISGWLGDRVQRRRIVAVAVACWSLATIGSGQASDIDTLLLMRGLVGIGEAGYATVAPTIIADLFPPDRRGRKLAWFYLAIPLGSAIGYLLGGWVGETWGWRAAFVVAGSPGLLLAVVAWFMPEPVRGNQDGVAQVQPLPLRAAWRAMASSPIWRSVTIGMTMMTFAMGGIAFWMPTFLQREYALGLGAANTAFGGVTVVAGLLGTLVGGALGDRAHARGPGGYLRVSGWGLLLGAPLVFAMPHAGGFEAALALAFFAEFALFLNTGPLNAAIVANVPPAIRASAFAVNTFCIHAFGDAGSPYLIGVVSDAAALSWAIALCGLPIAIGGAVLLHGAAKADAAAQQRAP
ncbi:MAG: MFS transporter [Deltaproteobacteria bacterium]|nr:MFS transporter [Deltaproteobacteria bacterium]